MLDLAMPWLGGLETHRPNPMRKLGRREAIELVRYAPHRGPIEP